VFVYIYFRLFSLPAAVGRHRIVVAAGRQQQVNAEKMPHNKLINLIQQKAGIKKVL
jgi:hypothetical protein